MKKIQLFALLCFSTYVGNVQAKHTIDSLKPQRNTSQRITPPDSLSINNTNLREGLLQLKDDNKALKYDKKWLEELSNRSLFPLMQSDIENTPSGQVAYDELTTEVLKERLARLDQKTPFHIEYNPILENVIKNFLKNRRSSLQRLMNISQYYFPLFERELIKNQVPKEIKYLAIVESALNAKATSRMGAKGLWQFMYYTGKMYDLEVNNYVDERPSEPEEYFDRQLAGLRVLDAAGKHAGEVVEVLHLPAQDCLVVETGAGRRLVPFVSALVPRVDLEAGEVQLADVGGLLEDLA